MKRSLGAKTLLYPAPVLIIGTYDSEGKPNLMNAAWGGICNSEPPSIAVSIRPTRLTYDNIVTNRAFTVNVPSVRFVKQADFAGLYSGREKDKFAATGLTPKRGDYVNAPFVEEFPMAIECSLLHTFELGAHTQFVGEIMDVKIDEDKASVEGLINVAALDAFTFSPGDMCYYRIGDAVGQAFSIGRDL